MSKIDIINLDEGKIQVLEITNIKSNVHDGTYQLNVDDKITICEVKIKPIGAKFDQKPPDAIFFDIEKELSEGNDTLSIECTVDKNNAPVKWFKGNQEILADNDKYEIISEGPIRCLLVHDVNEKDTNDYYCSLGSDVCKTEVKVIDNKPKQIFEPKYEKIDIYEGKGISMGIDLDSDHVKNCKWLKNGIQLEFNEHIKNEVINNQKDSLKIDKLVPNDSGLYELVLVTPNETGLIASIDLNVKPKPITIVRKISAKKVENTLLMLECEVSKPITNQLKFYWLKDGKEIDFGDKHVFARVVNDKICQLFIDKFDHADSGVYEFNIFDLQAPDLKETSSFKLDIKQNPFKTGMRVANSDVSESRLLQIEFETINDSYKMEDMKWLKNGQQLDLDNKEKYFFSKTGPNKFCLEIREIDAGDNGSYQCNIDEFSNKLNLSGIENIVKPKQEEKKSLKNLEHKTNNIEEESVQEILLREEHQTTETLNPLPVESESQNELNEAVINEVKEEIKELEQKAIMEADQKEINEEKVEEKCVEIPEESKQENLVEKIEEVVEEQIELQEEEIVKELIEEKTKEKPDEIEEKEPIVEPEVKVEEEQEKAEGKEELICEDQVDDLKQEEITENICEEKIQESFEEQKVEVVEENILDCPKAEEVLENKNEEDNFKDEPELKILSSDWKDEILAKETDNLQLTLGINKIIENPQMIILYKDNVKSDESDNLIIAIKKKTNSDSNEEFSEIKLMLTDLKKENTGIYRLAFKEAENENEIELGLTKLTVESKEKPITIISPLSSNKNQYFEDDILELNFKTSIPLDQKNIHWNLNTIPLDTSSSSNCEFLENVTNDGVEYILRIKSLKKGVNEFKLDIDNNQNENIYSDKVSIKIKEKPIEILNSTWTPEISLKEKETLELSLCLNKKVEKENIILLKNQIEIKPNENLIVSVIDNNLETEIKVSIPSLLLADTGNYKLILKDPKINNGEDFDLSETKLIVNETPIEIIKPLASDKEEYNEEEQFVLTITLSRPVGDSKNL